MKLGEKLRQARIAAGLSQRQLCGEEITRNMLSQIENGSAHPSMKTLQYLAARLEMPVSFFLEETGAVSPNQEAVSAARQHFDSNHFAAVLESLDQCHLPDPVYDREIRLLLVLSRLALAGQALDTHRDRYALELLEKTDCATAYLPEALNRQRLLLLGRIPGHTVAAQLPSLDEELYLRAREALQSGDATRSARLLEAMEDHTSPRWHLLRGEAYLNEQSYTSAAHHFRTAEAHFPTETAPKLELCYRELGNFRLAYEYACKQKR